MNIFAIFWNFLLRVVQEPIGIFFLFSLFHGLSQPILAWKESIMFFFFFFSKFFEFFEFFLEFSIPGRLGTHRNDFFYFLSFSTIPNLFWLEKKLWWCFLIFWFFLKFSIMGCVGTHQNDFFFFSLFLGLSQPLLAWKEAMMVFSNFFNLFAIFLEFSITGRVGTQRNDFFYFIFILTLSGPFLTYFGLKRSYDGVF